MKSSLKLHIYQNNIVNLISKQISFNTYKNISIQYIAFYENNNYLCQIIINNFKRNDVRYGTCAIKKVIF